MTMVPDLNNRPAEKPVPEGVLFANVRTCDLCFGMVDRFPNAVEFICRNCGAEGDRYTSFMTDPTPPSKP